MYQERAQKAVETRRKRKKHEDYVRRGYKASAKRLKITLAVRPFLIGMKNQSTISDSCVVCGESMENTLDIHHIDGDNTNNNPENLITLCASCHRIMDKAKSAEEIIRDYKLRHKRYR